MKRLLLSAMTSTLLVSWSPAFAGDYTTIHIDDVVGSSDEHPFGDYNDFFQSSDRPPKISFTLVTTDVCEIEDAVGNTLRLSTGTHNVSDLYFPFRIWDTADNNSCDNSAYSDITMKVDSLKTYTQTREVKIDQDNPFTISYFPRLRGAPVTVRLRTTFYKNFEAMGCLRLLLRDAEGRDEFVTVDSPVIDLQERALPLQITYQPTCLTSRLRTEHHQDAEKDATFNIEMGLVE